jgi:hypothetical protein
VQVDGQLSWQEGDDDGPRCAVANLDNLVRRHIDQSPGLSGLGRPQVRVRHLHSVSARLQRKVALSPRRLVPVSIDGDGRVRESQCPVETEELGPQEYPLTSSERWRRIGI